jgi:hypothetical protein
MAVRLRRSPGSRERSAPVDRASGARSVGEVVQRHGHEDEVDRAVRARQRFGRRAPELDAVARWFAACGLEHLQRRIDTDDAGLESLRQRMGEAAGAASDIQDDLWPSRGVRRHPIKPQPQHIRRITASGIVGGSNLGLIVVHQAALCLCSRLCRQRRDRMAVARCAAGGWPHLRPAHRPIGTAWPVARQKTMMPRATAPVVSSRKPSLISSNL